MKHHRSVSDVIAVLGLIAVASIAVVVGYSIISNYLSQTFKPNYSISVTYVKLTYVTSSENIGGLDYTTLKGEIGVSNPGSPRTIQICIVSSNITSGTLVPVTFSDQYSCPTVVVDSGYNVYGFLIRISNRNLQSVGCYGRYDLCPIQKQFYVVVKDLSSSNIIIVKPTYLVP